MDQKKKKISVGVVLAIIFGALIMLGIIAGLIYMVMPSGVFGSGRSENSGSSNIFDSNDFDHTRDGDSYDASRPVSKQMPLDQFMEVDVNVESMTVIIKPGDKYEVDYETVEGLEPKISQNGKSLSIIQQGSIKNPMQDYMSELYIMVPQNEPLAKVRINCGGSHIHIRDVTVYINELITGTGDIVVANVNSQSTAAKTDSGIITMESVDMGQSVLSTDTGNVDVRASRFGDLDISNNTGKTRIEGAREDLSNYNMNLSTDTGNITVQSQDQGKNYTTSGGSFSLTISSDTGDISIQ